MNDTTIKQKAKNYFQIFSSAGVGPKVFDFDSKKPNAQEIAAHAMWMCERVPSLIVEGKKDTAAEWIRFVEGILWSCGISSFKDLTSDISIIGI